MNSRRLSPEELRQRAQMNFDKAETRKREAAQSLQAHEAEKEAIAAKTERLRALRLAKEAADQATADVQKAEKAAAVAAALNVRKKPAAEKSPAKKSPAKRLSAKV